MPPITVSTDIDRPAEEVFAYATDPTRFAEWQKGVVDGTLEAAAPGNLPNFSSAISLCRSASLPRRARAALSKPRPCTATRGSGYHRHQRVVRSGVRARYETVE